MPLLFSLLYVVKRRGGNYPPKPLNFATFLTLGKLTVRRSTTELLGKNITTFKVKLNTLYKYYNINFYKSQIVNFYFFIFPFLLFNKS